MAAGDYPTVSCYLRAKLLCKRLNNYKFINHPKQHVIDRSINILVERFTKIGSEINHIAHTVNIQSKHCYKNGNPVLT